MESTNPKVVSMLQPTRVDKEKPKKLEGVKHVAFVTDKVKESIAPLNYNKPKPPALGGGNESTKHKCKIYLLDSSVIVLFLQKKYMIYYESS